MSLPVMGEGTSSWAESLYIDVVEGTAKLLIIGHIQPKAGPGRVSPHRQNHLTIGQVRSQFDLPF